MAHGARRAGGDAPLTHPARPRTSARLTHPRGILLVSAAAFVALATLAWLRTAVEVDTAVRDTLLAWALPPVVAAMRAVNYGGDWRFLLPGTLALFVLFPRARRRWWIWAALMVAAPLAEGAVKTLIGRPRPEDGGLGFPSGHATAAAAYFGAVVYLAGSLRSTALRVSVRAVALAIVPLVAAARVMLRAHWPSDAIGGIVLGLALAAVAMLADSLQGPDAGR